MSSAQRPLVRRDTPAPLHEQIAAEIRARIVDGTWPSHYKLEAEPDLAKRFDVSRGTLRRALRTLIDEGRLVQVHGRGTFVTGQSIEQPIAQEMTSLAEALRESGIPFSTEVVSLVAEPPPTRVARLLGLPADGRTWRLERLRTTGGDVFARLVNHIDERLCPGLDDYDLTDRSLYEVLESDFGFELAQARRTFEATAAHGELASALGVPAGHPVMYLEQLTYLADGRPVEYSDVWIRGDRLRLTSVLSRG